MWQQAMRWRMVRTFQRYDTDGDGSVSPDEFSARTAFEVELRDRDRDRALTRRDVGMQSRPRPEGAAPATASPPVARRCTVIGPAAGGVDWQSRRS